MSKILGFLMLLVSGYTLQAQPKFTALQYSPALPMVGSKVNFTYQKSYGPLVKDSSVELVIYQINGSAFKVEEPKVSVKNNLYSGTVTVQSETDALLFTFTSGKNKDNNKNSGYLIPIYGKNQQPVEGYYKAASFIKIGMGNYLAGIDVDAEAGLKLLKEGMEKFPELKNDNDFLNAYLNNLNSALKKDAQPVILAELKTIEAQDNLNEGHYNTLIQWYSRLKDKEQAEKFKTLLKEKFPEGQWRMGEASSAIAKEKDAAKKEALVAAFISKYGADKENQFRISNLQKQVAMAYAAEKNYEQLKKYAASLKPTDRAALYNNLSWNMAKKDEALPMALSMSKEAYQFAHSESENPSIEKPENLTSKQWKDQRNQSKAMYGDTYAFILYKTGDFKTGYPIAKDAAIFNELKDADYNERYALLAVEVLSAKDAQQVLEPMVKEGASSEKIKEALKKLYVSIHKSDDGYDKYLTALEEEARLKKRAEIAASITNDPAPNFKLKDFEGKEVSLNDMKGKIVVVDFWATWCGPCIASMPAMNKALTKFKDRKDVAFLFVDTWENVENKLDNAKKFMTQKDYPFYVLMDNDNKMVTDFKVSGIPTKFILDKKGNIRFTSVGFGGNDDALVDELSTMIELAEK